MKVKLYNQKGKEIGTADLPKEIFDVPLNSDLVHQVAVSQMANRRQVLAHTKTRGEVRGGGKKPWRQKGTGRARHGSIRSPIWRGGSITFGPRKDKVYKKDVPKKMKRKALFMVLSEKARNNLLIVVDKLELENHKTKAMAELIKKLPLTEGSRLVLTNGQKNIFLSARNIDKTGVIESKNINVLDLLNYKYLLMPEDAVGTIKNTFLKK